MQTERTDTQTFCARLCNDSMRGRVSVRVRCICLRVDAASRVKRTVMRALNISVRVYVFACGPASPSAYDRVCVRLSAATCVCICVA